MYKKLNQEQMNHLRDMDAAYSNAQTAKEMTEIVKSVSRLNLFLSNLFKY